MQIIIKAVTLGALASVPAVVAAQNADSAGARKAASVAQWPPPPPQHGAVPYVSPDGKLISYFSDRDGHPAIYVIAPDGSGDRMLIEFTHRITSAGWSADGRTNLFSEGVGADSTQLNAIDVGGTHRRPLAIVAGRDPTLSPDGRQLAVFVGKPPSFRLTIARANGDAPKTLLEVASIAYHAVWSPDGRHLAYAQFDSTRKPQIWVVNSDGSGAHQVTHIPAAEGAAEWPAWSPDSKRLAVQVGSYSPQQSVASIYIVDVTTGAAHDLSHRSAVYLDETPSWFPDGKRLAFQSSRTGKMEVWVMNIDGSGQRQVTH